MLSTRFGSPCRSGPSNSSPASCAPAAAPDNRKNCSGTHKAHGLLFLALTDERGNLIWISSARPGEITAARHDPITRHLRAACLGALADLSFVGLDDDPDDAPVVFTGGKATGSHRLTDATRRRTGWSAANAPPPSTASRTGRPCAF